MLIMGRLVRDTSAKNACNLVYNCFVALVSTERAARHATGGVR